MGRHGEGLRLPLTEEFRNWLGEQNLHRLTKEAGLPSDSPVYRLQKGWSTAHGKRYPIHTVNFDVAERLLGAKGREVTEFWPDA